MPTRAYDIPGVQATILDYQITPAPITNPGEIVVLLGDLPDSIGVNDPDNPGQTINVVIPKNVPILINSESDLGVISGQDLVTALSNLGGPDRHLELVNVLPMLSSELPLAICKITKRNGERPDPTNSLDQYEALEYAYEALGNYPAGRVVPMPVSIEDKVLRNDKLAVPLKTFESFSVTAIPGDFGNNVIDLANSTFSLNLVTGLEEYHEDMNIRVSAVPSLDGTDLAIKYDFIINNEEVFSNTTLATISQVVLDVTNHTDGTAADTFQRFVEAYDAAHPGGVLSPTPVAAPDPTLFTDDATMDAAILAAKDELRYTIVTPTIFVDGGNAGDPLVDATLDQQVITILDQGAVIGYLTTNLILKAPTVGVDGAGSVTWEDLIPAEVIDYKESPAIEPTTWFNAGVFVFNNTGAITEEAVSPTNSLAAVELPIGSGQLSLTQIAGTENVDASFYTTYKYDIATEIYTDETVFISVDRLDNNLTISSSITIEGLDTDGNVGIVIDGITYPTVGLDYSTINETHFINADYDLNFNNIMTIRFHKGLALDEFTAAAFEYEISIVPTGAAYDKRLVQFCFDLTKDMNDCAAVIGTIPPATVSAEDIASQVNRIKQNISTKTYATPSVDNGLYLTVTTGSQKVSETGGITNFEGSKVSDFDVTNRTINVIGGLEFEVGDYVDLEIIKKGRYYIEENMVESKVETANGYELTLKNSFAGTQFANLNNTSTRYCYITNKKDRKGSYLAALYAVEANNYGIDKAPFNYTMPGSAEIFYTRTQLDALLDAKVTPINREAFNTNGVVIDTPTMARDKSDFTDQGTVGLVFYFIRQLRSIANARKGERFGTGDRQVVFQTELEAPFVAQVGQTIDAYDLQVDWSNLNINHTLDVSFAIREAKKLKFVKITARLF